MHALTTTSTLPRILPPAITILLWLSLSFGISSAHAAPPAPFYVGSISCQPCHAQEYRSFTIYAKKSRSFESIERLRHGLTDEEIMRCYGCHTTGYGKPGGFVSLENTPQLKNAGCEVCHGPGSMHAKTGDPASIKIRLSKEDCELCHTSERVSAFRFKPMIHGGAH